MWDGPRCDGVGGASECRSRGAISHIREGAEDRHGNRSYTLECGSCALQPHPLGPTRKLAHEELAHHRAQYVDHMNYKYGYHEEDG